MQTTRDLTKFYTGSDDPKLQTDLAHVTGLIKEFVTQRKGKTSYLKDNESLLQALTEFDAIYTQYRFGTMAGVYYWMRNILESDDADIKASLNLAEAESTKLFNQLQFFPISLGTLPQERQEVIMMDVRLAKYHFWLSEIFASAQYQLSEQQEQMLTTLSGPAYRNWTRMIEEFLYTKQYDLQGDQLSFDELMDATKSLDTTRRDQAAGVINTTLIDLLPVAEKELNSILDYKHRIDEMRGYDRPDRSAFVRDSIDAGVADTLSEVTQRFFATSQQYYALKAKMLGLDILKYHERNIPIIAGTEQEWGLNKSVDLVASVFGEIKLDYGVYVRKMFDEGRVDCLTRKGKRGGAFCITNLNAQQGQRILLNHTNKLRDVATIAHEFGHSLNGYLSAHQHVGGVNHGSGGYFIAEVASTFFEGFVFDRLLSEVSTPQQQIALLMSKLNDEISTIHRQIACYEFEKALHAAKHESGYVTAEQIGALFQTHMSAYMGPAVEQSSGSENRWLYRSHIRSFFYTYSYSAGLMLSYALQSKVHADPQFIHQIEEKYFSQSEASSPAAIFASLGIDIHQPAIWETGLTEVQSLLDQVQSLVDTHGRDA